MPVPHRQGAQDLLDFLSAAFAATERERITRMDGSIGHAEVQIGDSVVMVTDATDQLGVVVLETREGAEHLAMGLIPGAEIRPGVRVTRTEVLEVAARA